MSIVNLIEEFGGWVKKAMHYVTSADKAYHWLREQGIDISRSIVREVWQEVGQKERWETVIQTWGIERPIPKAWIVERESVESTSLLAYIKSQWYNPDTGEWTEKLHTYVVPEVKAFIDLEEDVYDQEVDYAELNGYKLVGIWLAGYEKLKPKKR